jgi:uncharacterized protein YjiS (DUF1127 family)
MGTLSSIRNFARAAAHRIAESRRRRETQRVLESLPPHILKDIGYGDRFDVGNTM